jgi:hypothetical protein
MRLSGVSGTSALSLACVVVMGTPSPARADLVFFTSGRSMSVKSHRVEGDTIVLVLRQGGEMTAAASAIARIGPDEVAYPEPGIDVHASPGSNLTPDQLLQTDPSSFGPLIDRKAAEHGVNPALVRAVIQVESNYRPSARSAKGAMGLMQLMPATARQYSVRDPYDPESNIEAGVRYLKSLLDRLPLNLALAAYNAGEAAVQRFGGVPPYAETRAYVSRVLSLVR